MEKKKILFIIPTLTGGGAERVLLNILNRINCQRYQIDLAVVTKSGDFWNEIPLGISTTILFQSPFLARVLNKLHVLYNINFVYRKIIQQKLKSQYDVGISFSDGSYTDVLLFLGDHVKWKVSWVHSCYTSFQSVRQRYSGKYRQRVIESRCKQLDEMIFVSRNARKEYSELFGEYPNMHVIYNLIDKEKVLLKSREDIPVNFNQDEVNIIAVGNLLPVKGYEILIEAARILKDKGYSFKIRILGKGYLEKRLKADITKSGVEDHIILMGFKQNPYPYVAKSDIYVMPSRSEALPMSLIEAMVLGLPVVSTNCSGCMEVTDNGVYGLISSYSSILLAKNIEKLITDKDKRSAFSLLSLKRARQFDEEQTIQQLYELFDQ